MDVRADDDDDDDDDASMGAETAKGVPNKP